MQKPKVPDFLAKAISLLLHPLLLPTYIFLLFTNPPYHTAIHSGNARFTFALILFISTFAIPSILVMIMKTLGLVESLHLPSRRERTVPFLLTGVIYYVAVRFLQRYNLPFEIVMMMLGSTSMILLALLINLRWKISIHMMGMGGAAGMILCIALVMPGRFFLPVIAVTALSGLLGFARLQSGSHKPPEVYAGFAGGFLLFFILFMQALSFSGF